MLGRLPSPRKSCTMQPETLGNRFYLIFLAVFFYDCNLDFTWISKLSISFPRMTSIMRIWRKYLSGLVARGSRSSKSGFPRFRRDSGFSRKIGIIPTKSGWLDTLLVSTHLTCISQSLDQLSYSAPFLSNRHIDAVQLLLCKLTGQ